MSNKRKRSSSAFNNTSSVKKKSSDAHKTSEFFVKSREKKTIIDKNQKQAQKNMEKSEYFTENFEKQDQLTRPSTSKEYSPSESDSNSSVEWEEVEDADLDINEDEILDNYHPEIPKEGVNIVLEAPISLAPKRNKKNVDDLLRQQVNRLRKSVQLDMHKTNILCLLARGMFLNKLALNQNLLSLALSQLANFKFNITSFTQKFALDYTKWFHKKFELIAEKRDCVNMAQSIANSFESCIIRSEAEFVVMFLTILRAYNANIQARLCYSLKPVPLKPEVLLLSDKQREIRKNAKTKKEQKETSNKISKIVKKQKSKTNRDMLSSSDEEVVAEQIKQTSKLIEHWVEMYIPSEERWICIDPINKKIDDIQSITKSTHNPLHYVFAFDNSNFVKDVTKRYCSDWLTSKFKNSRVDDKWLKQTLLPYRPLKRTPQEKKEDYQLDEMHTSKPLPNKISDYKNHPLYVLERHLLKFQVLYPPNPPPLGFFRGEPVYARECVQEVHAKDYWRRKARVVRKNEEPYKVSKARKKWDKNLGAYLENLPQNLYGLWQTDEYEPPTAKNGKVPRNEYGNVELFMPCMLPKGTVHLRLPGLIRVANKLKIDCVPAVVSFDNHSTGSHPVFDGFVVCEEFKDILIEAWEEDQKNASDRVKSKREKRALRNWRFLVKSLLIREALKIKYGENSSNVPQSTSESESLTNNMHTEYSDQTDIEYELSPDDNPSKIINK